MDAEPLSITHATFQVEINRDELSSRERRAMRAESRSRWLWPGVISPRWATAEAFRYAFGGPDSDDVYVVPKQFPFDGASVPWPLTLVTPKTHSQYLGAAALHDWLYGVAHNQVPREKADEMFREAMIVLGTSWIWAMIMVRAVRAGGWAVWYKRKPETLAYKIIHLPFLIRVLPVAVITFVRLFVGLFFYDIPSIGRYRRQADEIEAYDAPENA